MSRVDRHLVALTLDGMEKMTVQINGETFTVGRTAETVDGVVATEVWKYVLDENGAETGRIVRVAGLPVIEVARALAKSLEATRNFYTDEKERSSLIDEYTAIGHEYQYGEMKLADTPVDWPANAEVECSAVRGGSEGHYVHVDMVVPPPPYTKGRPQHIRLLTVKTFRGFDHAWLIAKTATVLMGYGR